MSAGSRMRRWKSIGKLAAAGMTVGALLIGTFSGPAMAATPKMTVGITPITDSVASGGEAAYRLVYECSNITPDDCVAPVINMPRPVGVSPDGVDVPAGASAVQGGVDLDSSAETGDNLAIQLKNLAPGTTGEITVTWTIPAFTTLPGTEFPGDIEVVYQDGSGAGGDQTASATTPNPIVSTATPALNVVKQTVTPDNQAKVVADEPVTYRIYACNPTQPVNGALDYRDLTIVDTLPKGAVFVSATGGGTYNAANETVTWTNPTPARNSCNSPTETYEVTVTYPAATFVPPAADPQQTNTITNVADATATALDGTTLTATSSQQHSFIGPPLSSGGNITYRVQKGVSNDSVANSNTNSLYEWSTVVGWHTTAAPDADFNRYRPFVIQDRMPCLIGGAAVSPTITNGSDPLASAYPGTLTVPSDQCHNPATNLRILNGNATSNEYFKKAELATWDGTTARIRTINKADLGASGWVYLHAGESGYNPGNGDITLNLPANEIVTDLRIVGEVPHGAGVGAFYRFRSSNTAEFAASGLMTMTNSLHDIYGNEFAKGGTPTAGIVHEGERAAQKNFFPTQVDPQITKRALDKVDALKPGDQVRWRVAISNGPNGNIPMLPRLVDVLPAGLEYVADSATWTNLGALPEPTLTEGTTTIDGVQRTTLTWNWPNGTELNHGDPSPTVEFATDVTLSAASGSHSGNEAQIAVLFDRDTNLTNPAIGAPVDEWDLDGDGNVTETVGKASTPWAVTPASGAVISKQVKGANDADWTTDGLTNATFDGSNSQVVYRLQITNPNTAPLTDMVVYDVFPHVGDTAIGGSLVGVARGSEWTPTFDSITNLPAGATVEYSTSVNACRPELFGGTAGQPLPLGCLPNWSATAPSDPSTVKAIKVSIPRVDPSATPTNIEFRMQAPALTGASDLAFTNPEKVANNNVAWHTFRQLGAGVRESLPSAEAPAVSVRRAAGQIGDRVWLDANRDGIQDAGENGIAGIEVELRDAAGNLVLDAAGDPIRTTTDANGEYRFTVPLGEWSVAFVNIPAQYEFTLASQGGDDAKDSDATGAGVPTHTVTVSDPIRDGADANVNLNLDAGLVLAEVSITKDDGKTIVKPGEETTYTITVTNNSTTADAQNVTVTDQLPAELEYVNSSNSGAYDSTDHSVSWDLGTIAAGASVDVTVTAKVKADTPADTDITNTATVTGPCSADCDATDVDTTPPAVQIEKTDHQTVVKPGDTLTYDLTATNLSAKQEATGVVVTDELPAELTFVSATDGGTYDAATRTVTWGLGTLAISEVRTIQVTVTVDAATPTDTDISNIAKIDTDHGCVDPDGCEDTDTDTTPPSVSIVKDDGKSTVVPGEDTTYDLVVTNHSTKTDATGVIVTDALPAELDFVSASNGGVYDDATRLVTWDLGTLAAGDSVTVQVTATVRADTPSDAVITNVGTVDTNEGCVEADNCESTDIDRTPPRVTVEKDDHKSVVRPGESTTYDVIATNTSTEQVAEDVVVTDTLPAELEFESADNNGVYDADAHTVTWNLGDLATSESRTLQVTATVNADTAPDTDIVNVAVIDTKFGCEITEDCESTDTDTTPPRVSIEKDDHKNVVGLGEELTYDLTVTNHSAKTDATEVVVTDQLPAQLTYVSATDGGVYDADAHTVTWNLGTLPKGETRLVQVTATVSETTPAGDTITNTADVDTAEGCVVAEDCETVDIDHTPDVQIVKDDHKTVVAPGEQLDYDVTVTNRAEWGATGVIATDELPANATFVSASDGGVYDAQARTVTWNLGDLAGGEAKTVQVSVTVAADAQAGDTVTNVANVTTDQGCFDASDCATQDRDRVDPHPVTPALPITGGTAAWGLVGLGGAGLLAGAILLLMRRRKVSSES